MAQGYGHNSLFQLERNQQRFPVLAYYRGFQADGFEQQHRYAADFNVAYKRLVVMVVQNRSSNNFIAQQQYLMQLLNKNFPPHVDEEQYGQRF